MTAGAICSNADTVPAAYAQGSEEQIASLAGAADGATAAILTGDSLEANDDMVGLAAKPIPVAEVHQEVACI